MRHILVIVLVLFLPFSDARRSLPSGIIAGYTNQANVSTILQTIDDGCNVLIWSFIELQRGNITDDGVQGGPNHLDVAGVISGIDARGLSNEVVHLVSIGGWAAPHPTTGFDKLHSDAILTPF